MCDDDDKMEDDYDEMDDVSSFSALNNSKDFIIIIDGS